MTDTRDVSAYEVLRWQVGAALERRLGNHGLTIFDHAEGRDPARLRPASHARSLSFEEMMNLLSGIRLGVSLKLLKSPRVETISRVMIHAQTAHLERTAGRRLDETDADVFRATYVREALAGDADAGDSDSGAVGRGRADGAD